MLVYYYPDDKTVSGKHLLIVLCALGCIKLKLESKNFNERKFFHPKKYYIKDRLTDFYIQ